MKKILIIIILTLFTSNTAYSNQNRCDGIKKFSKEFLKCNARNIKKGTLIKVESIKKGTASKTENFKLSIKKIGNKINKKIKKKE
jgi:hypothetical protein